MLKAYKYRLYPNKQQEILLQKSFGCCRWIYNWALKEKHEFFVKENKSVSIFQLDLKLKSLKASEETKWLKEVNSQSLQQALKNLDIAYTRFFKKQGKYPVFKSKKARNPFQIRNRSQFLLKNRKFLFRNLGMELSVFSIGNLRVKLKT